MPGSCAHSALIIFQLHNSLSYNTPRAFDEGVHRDDFESTKDLSGYNERVRIYSFVRSGECINHWILYTVEISVSAKTTMSDERFNTQCFLTTEQTQWFICSNLIVESFHIT